MNLHHDDHPGVGVPEHVPPELVADFDHYDTAFLGEDALEAYDHLRDERPVFYTPRFGGFWVLSRRDDVREAMQRPDVWSNRHVSIPSRVQRLIPISLDPPEHTKFRQLITPGLSPQRVVALEPEMRVVTAELLDELVGRDRCEVLSEFAKPFPARIFTRLLGLPSSEWPRFMDWNHVLIHSGDPQERLAMQRAVGAYLGELVDRRVEEPADDLISTLAAAEVDGERLTRDELIGTVLQQFSAGFDTVTAVLAFSLRFLAGHPELRRELVAEPSIVPGAVEELLRLHSVALPTRTATCEVAFAGVTARAGDRVLLALPAASRELGPGEATAVDFRREPNRHLAFGVGPHRCAGSHLARQELRVALEEWHRRFPEYRIAEGHRDRFTGGGVLGLESLELRLGP